MNINSNFKETTNNIQTLIAFRVRLKELIGANTKNNQKFLIHPQPTTIGQCTPCFSKQQHFQAPKTRETFTNFHLATCHSNNVICLLECLMWKIQYVAKSQTSFNISLNNHWKDIKTCKHFNDNEHTFSKHSEFIIIEQLRNMNATPTEILK